MKSTKYQVFLTITILFLSAFTATVAAQQKTEQIEDTGDIILKPSPKNKDALFKNKEKIQYTLQILNNTNKKQYGKLSYLITTDDGKKIRKDSVRFVLGAKSDKEIEVNLLPKPAGFYRLNFIVNTPDYDDTIRKVFGVAPENIRSQLHKPADFDAFWKQTRDQLKKVAPKYKINECKDLSTSD